MIKQLTTFGAAIAMGAMAFIPTASASAQSGYYNGGGYYQPVRGDYNRGDRYRGYDRYQRNDRYQRGDRYRGNRGYYRGDRGYRCDNGTGGTIIGAIAGGLLGHEVAGRRGDQTTGAIIGAGVGALAGRAIDRSDSRRC